jgi:hypothetical protein
MLDRITNPFTLVLVARINTEVIRRGTGGLLVLLHPEILKPPRRVSYLVLADPAAIKLGGRDQA